MERKSDTIVDIKVRCPVCGEERIIKVDRSHGDHYKARGNKAKCLSCATTKSDVSEAFIHETGCTIFDTPGRCDGYLNLTCEYYERCMDIAAKNNWRGWNFK